MSGTRVIHYLGCALGLLTLSGASCDRQGTATTPGSSSPSTAPNSPPTTVPVADLPAPTPRAPSEFVRSPRRVILGGDEVRLPIDLITYMPVVTFGIPDGSRQRMLIDTGSDAMVMTPAFAAAGRLTTRPSDRSSRDVSGTVQRDATVLVTRLQLGAARFEDFDADTGPLYAGVDALLGYPLWKDVLLTIDYPSHTLILKRGGLPPPDGRRIVPLRIDEQERLLVRATLDGRETWLNLDTGWGTGGSVELTTAHAARASWTSPPGPTMATNAVHGTATEKLGRLQGDLVVGRYRFVQPVAGTNAGLAADILGAVALAHFTVTLDLHNLRVAFDRPTADPIVSGPVFVAGFDCDLRSQPLKVLNILPDSEAARAGLQPGDLLLTIDRRPARDGLLAHAAGDYAMTLQRGTRTLTLTVPMTKLVP